ncbi:MAG TPA: Mut7-C RNAse domain-containing protein, partial [Mariprofundaceae bacterium]|nr:Mut7-C RNAse domain-containing protein [Mariprofundaceae bacterium]
FHTIDWLHAPFSRCLVCNRPLVPADPARLAEVPPFSREQATVLLSCSGCGRLFWDGSHVRRMRARLSDWQQRRT